MKRKRLVPRLSLKNILLGFVFSVAMCFIVWVCFIWLSNPSKITMVFSDTQQKAELSVDPSMRVTLNGEHVVVTTEIDSFGALNEQTPLLLVDGNTIPFQASFEMASGEVLILRPHTPAITFYFESETAFNLSVHRDTTSQNASFTGLWLYVTFAFIGFGSLAIWWLHWFWHLPQPV